VKKGAVILLILYAITMLSYGSLEMTHDLLHYLASHHHSQLHSHAHGNHHHFHDHQQTVVSHAHDGEEQRELSTLIHFFLFAERKPAFTFLTEFMVHLCFRPSERNLSNVDQHPDTPPPEIQTRLS